MATELEELQRKLYTDPNGDYNPPKHTGWDTSVIQFVLEHIGADPSAPAGTAKGLVVTARKCRELLDEWENSWPLDELVVKSAQQVTIDDA